MNRTLGHRAGGKGFEPVAAEPVQDRLGEDRSRRVAGAEKEHIEAALSFAFHGAPQQQEVAVARASVAVAGAQQAVRGVAADAAPGSSSP